MPKSDLPFLSDDYSPVADRLRLFYARYSTGRVITRLESKERGEVVFVAEVFRFGTDERPSATGWASEREGDGEINSVACLENAETSAIGRALANLGFTASRQRPSAEEMAKANRARARLAREAESSVRRAAVRLGRVAETVAHDSPVNAELAARADWLTDMLDLLHTATRAGLRARRAAAFRARLLGSRDAPVTVERFARRIRRWIVESAASNVDSMAEKPPEPDGP
jgi:hypothetical protein